MSIQHRFPVDRSVLSLACSNSKSLEESPEFLAVVLAQVELAPTLAETQRRHQ